MASQTLEDCLDEVFGEKSAEPAFQTVVHNILEEPIEDDTKRRLLAPLLPRDYVPWPPPRKPKIKNTKAPRGMERFDPFHSMNFERKRFNAADVFGVKRSWAEILSNPRGENPIQERRFNFLIEKFPPKGEVEEQRGKIITKWRFYKHLERSITPEIMRKMDGTEKIHKLRFNYTCQLRNIENDEKMVYSKESERSPWFDRLSETEDWVEQEEEKRFRGENIEAQDTKWVFEEHLMVEVKRIEDPQQPLRVGVGVLPDWLRHKKGMIALDHYGD